MGLDHIGIVMQHHIGIVMKGDYLLLPHASYCLLVSAAPRSVTSTHIGFPKLGRQNCLGALQSYYSKVTLNLELILIEGENAFFS